MNASDSEITVNNNEGSETANEEAEGLMEIPENEEVGLGVYISLSEEYKSLNKAGKEKMKKDEVEKWVLFKGKQKHFEFHSIYQYFLIYQQLHNPLTFFVISRQ